ncbi:hypothetical protein RTBOTA2_005379 [Rhodotorula toruloides]|nr:hypothetical protein RTBOTA2_005379 [Rhodotorula toruloides]
MTKKSVEVVVLSDSEEEVDQPAPRAARPPDAAGRTAQTSNPFVNITSATLFSFPSELDRARAVTTAFESLARGSQKAPDGYWGKEGGWMNDFALCIAWCPISLNYDNVLNNFRLAYPTVLLTVLQNSAKSATDQTRLYVLKRIPEALVTALGVHVEALRASLNNPGLAPVPLSTLRGLTFDECEAALQTVDGYRNKVNLIISSLATDEAFADLALQGRPVLADWFTWRLTAFDKLFPSSFRDEARHALRAKALSLDLQQYANTLRTITKYATVAHFLAMLVRKGVMQAWVTEAQERVIKLRAQGVAPHAPIVGSLGQSLPADGFSSLSMAVKHATKNRLPSQLSPGDATEFYAFLAESVMDDHRRSTEKQVQLDRPHVVYPAVLDARSLKVAELEEELARLRLEDGSGETDFHDFRKRASLFDRLRADVARQVDSSLTMLPASSAGGSSSSGGGSPASPSNSGFNEPLFSRLKLPDELLARRIKDAQAADKNTVQHDLLTTASSNPTASDATARLMRASASRPACSLSPAETVEKVNLACSATVESLVRSASSRKLHVNLAQLLLKELKMRMEAAKEDVQDVWQELVVGEEEMAVTEEEANAGRADPSGGYPLLLDNIRVISILVAFVQHFHADYADRIDAFLRQLASILATLLIVSDTALILPALREFIDSFVASFPERPSSDPSTGWIRSALAGVSAFSRGAAYACCTMVSHSSAPANKGEWLSALLFPPPRSPSPALTLGGGTPPTPLPYVLPCFKADCADALVLPTRTEDGKYLLRQGAEDLRLSVGAIDSRRGPYLPYRLVLRRQTHPCPYQIIGSLKYSPHLLATFASFGYIVHYRCKVLRGKSG